MKKLSKSADHANYSLPSRSSLHKISPITNLWPFAQWGLDILGKLPTVLGEFKYLIIAPNYFSKWVEAEPLVTITKVDVRRFIWRNIVTRFGVS